MVFSFIKRATTEVVVSTRRVPPRNKSSETMRTPSNLSISPPSYEYCFTRRENNLFHVLSIESTEITNCSSESADLGHSWTHMRFCLVCHTAVYNGSCSNSWAGM